MKKLIALIGIVVAAVVVAGCGGDEEQVQTQTSTLERTKVEIVEAAGEQRKFDATVIYKRFAPGVVTVTSLFGSGDADILAGRGDAGQGAGFVLDARGHVATNAHVITEGQGKNIKKAREVFVQFGDGNQVPARIVGFDPNSDVGLLEIDPKGLRLVPLRFARSSRVRVGEPVAAIGSPFGEAQSLSVGVVSATNRSIEALTDFQIGDAIQTDAAINRGNSGGPLLDSSGAVIGINSQIRSSSGGSEGVGFAVPSDTVRRSIEQLRANGEVAYGYIGVSAQALYPQLARRLDLPVEEGALVAEVVEDGPADRAGIKGGGKEIRFQATLVKPGGDVITKIGGRRFTRERDLSELIARYRPGDRIRLEVYRGNDRREVQIELGERPSNIPE
jgi:S1-C subfamily serine protease